MLTVGGGAPVAAPARANARTVVARRVRIIGDYLQLLRRIWGGRRRRQGWELRRRPRVGGSPPAKGRIMSHKTHTPAEVEDKLWKAIEHHKTGMLGLVGSHQHFQPMTAFAEPETSTIWFFVSHDNDLMEAANGGGAQVMFTFQSREL